MLDSFTKDELKKLIEKVVRRELETLEDRVEELECAVFFAPDSDQELNLSELSLKELDLLIKQAQAQLDTYQLKVKKPKSKSKSSPKSNADNPVFYRFIRPSYTDSQGVTHPNHPKQGVTLRIELDYANRVIIVNYSICDGDLFNRDTGRDLADRRRRSDEKTIIIDMPEKGSDVLENFGGIVPYIIDQLDGLKSLASDDHELVSDISKILKQYSSQ